MLKTIEDVISWLHDNGFSRFAETFVANEIDPETLYDLDATDLARMGLPVGPAKKILKAIAALREADRVGRTPPALRQLATAEPAYPLKHAERRQITVMFCDMVDSTAIASRYDPEDLSTIMISFRDCCSQVVSRYGGYTARYLGDGLLVYFGYPRAREDDAERAVRAGLEMIRAVSGLQASPGLSLQVRIGVATGLVVVGESAGGDTPQESVVVGETPNLAARLQTLATPNAMLISQATRRLAGPQFVYADAGAHRVKGFDEPVPVTQVLGERHTVSRFESRHEIGLTPMFGRDNEIALILDRFARAESGEGRLVLITGEAGFGKSRIARAVIDRLPCERRRLAHLQCLPYYTASALHPVIGYLGREADFSATDDNKTCKRKLRELLRDAGVVDDTDVGLLTQLLGLRADARETLTAVQAPEKRHRLLRALTELLAGLSEPRPLIVLLEDAHWSDPTTLALIEQSLDLVQRHRILILLTERPGPEHGFARHPAVTRITLERLGNAEIESIVRNLSRAAPLADATVDEIVAKSDGVPLFAEELTKTTLVHSTRPGGAAAGETPPPSIPSSLHDSLMERLDRLPAVKEYAQVGSVIGREFKFGVLAATLQRPAEEIVDALDQLVETGVLTGDERPPEGGYRFRHALICDVAYQSLLKRRRQHWHARVAQVLEEHFPAVVAAEPELPAQHYTRAGLPEPALRYWVKAADLSFASYNLREALDKAQAGLAQADKLPDSTRRQTLTLRLLLVQALALRSTAGFANPASIGAFERALAIAEALGDRDSYAAAARGLCVSLYLRGRLGEAHDLAQRMIANGAEPRHLIDGFLTLGQVLFYRGSPVEASRQLAKAWSLTGRLDERHRDSVLSRQFDSRCAIQQFQQQTLVLTGKPRQALRLAEQAVARARKLAQPFAVAGTLCHLCLTRLMLELPFAGRAAEFKTLTDDYGMPFWGMWALFCEGVAGEAAGGVDAALARVAAARKQLQHSGVQTALTAMLSAEIRLLLERGDAASAEARIDLARNVAAQTGVRYYEPEIDRLHGRLLAARGDVEAERYLLRAVAEARNQKALWWELRAAGDLARLWLDRGRAGDCAGLLDPLLGRFDDALELPDLCAARQLRAAASEHVGVKSPL